MENLRAYKNYIVLLSILWHGFVMVAALAVTYGLASIIDVKFAYAIGGAVLVIGTAIVSVGLAGPYLATTEFLARAILHVSSEQADTPAPNTKSIKASKEFMERLASYVYDMSSASVMSQYPTKHAAQDSSNNQTGGVAPQTPTSNIDSMKMSPVPFFIINKNREVISASQSGLTFMDIGAGNVIGKKFYDLLRFSFPSNDTLDSWLSFTESKSVTASRSWDRVKVITPNEKTKQVDMSVRFSKDDSNGNEITIVLFDQTEKYGQDDAGASFVSMAVHELRTPLTIMRGYIEVFEDELEGKLDSEQSEFLRNLSVQAQQLGSFVSNIQNLARIEANALELQLKSDNWSEVLGSTLNDMDMRARVRHKTIERDIADNMPAVGVDRTTIYEVIVNIVENAIKYTHSDAPIKVSSYLKNDDWIETTVEDRGIGIPDGLLGHVFDKFYRSHRSSKSVGGTGLGLYISKTIVEAHGGEIWVKTKEGVGSTFGFTIPTYSSIASQANSSDNNSIERSAHGWIKNHTLYRG